MNLKAFFQKNLIHIGILVFMVLLTVIYFKPQLEGYNLKQHDVEQVIGGAHEAVRYRDDFGKEPMWTNSMFGGMPTDQISTQNPGNWFKEIYDGFINLFPYPMGLILMHLLSFYVFARLLRLNPIVGAIGAIAFTFASYELIIIQAGHITKSVSVAFLPALLGSFIYAYRTNRMWGIVLSGAFMALELIASHVQVTYYFLFVLLLLGFYFLYEAIRDKKLKDYVITSAGLLAVFAVAIFISSGNLSLTANYVQHTTRGANDITITPNGEPSKVQSAGLDRDYITQWSYGIGESFTFVSPYVKGGGSVPLAETSFRDDIENSDLGQDEIKAVLGNYSYWGDQPITSGPVYLGVISVMLALLGLIFLKDRIKWVLFAVTILAVLLSWGKNFMGLTNFFIDNVPMYNKFRTVTIILVLVELTIPVMGVLFLDQLIKQRESMLQKKKPILITVGAFTVFLIVVKMVGLNDGYSSKMERQQMDGLVANIEGQIRGLDPAMARSQYNLDITQPQQVKQFAEMQAEQYFKNYDNVKEVRKDIFHSSMNRSILFTILAGLLLAFFLYSSAVFAPTVLTVGLLVLTMADLIPVAYEYLGNQEDDYGNYRYWEDASAALYPISTNEADEQILTAETMQNPALKAAVDKAAREGKQKADELGYTGTVRTNLINSYRFMALNRGTNYRVFDLNGGFSSSRASYLHKSLGGYHGAKLRNISNLFDFHLSKMNNKVYDMMNVKYFIQQGENGTFAARPNPTALGPVWLVKRVEQYPNANDEIRALGSQFKLNNAGAGILLVNKAPVKEAVVYGGEKLQYLLPGKDTMDVPLANGIAEGTEAMMVMDINGKTDLVPMQTMSLDTAKSFTALVSLKVTNEFKPQEEAVMVQSEAKQLSATQFSGEGKIHMVSYGPNKMIYSADVKGKQLAVFSEVYYPHGWKAYVDKKEVPIRKVNYILRGLELSDGKHRIEFIYDVPSYYTANNIARIASSIMFLLIGGAIFVEIRKRRRARAENEKTA